MSVKYLSDHNDALSWLAETLSNFCEDRFSTSMTLASTTDPLAEDQTPFLWQELSVCR